MEERIKTYAVTVSIEVYVTAIDEDVAEKLVKDNIDVNTDMVEIGSITTTEIECISDVPKFEREE